MPPTTNYLSRDLENSQVLQRNLDTNEATVTTLNGEQISLKPGGPYSIDNKQNIYVGDIWVMAGQSNMRGHGYLADPIRNEPIQEAAPLNHIHLYDSTEKWRVASDPTHRLALSPRRVHHTFPDPTVRNPEICQYRGASLGPSFGARYSEIQGVPVGLIASAHGGVSLNDWARPSELNHKTYNTTLYGAMMDRISKIGGRIAGVLWYQGESDTLKSQDAETYGKRFKQWIKVLREDMKQHQQHLPIVFVQLGAHRVNVPETVKNWMTIQDQQRLLFGMDDYTAGVASRDCGLDDRLHLSKNGLDVLGRRLAKAASLAIDGKAKDATPLPAKFAKHIQKTFITGLLEIHMIKLELNLSPLLPPFALDIWGFEVENQNNVTILRAHFDSEDGKQSIVLYLSGNPIPHQDSQATVSYGMNQKEVNLNTGQEIMLPVFRNIPVVASSSSSHKE